MNLPNLLTAARIALTPVILYELSRGSCVSALWLLLIAGITDGLDGWIARRWRMHTRFGALLDPIADKLLLTTLYVSLAIAEVVPRWLAWLVVGRDLWIVAMVGAGLLFTRVREFPPSIWGKISTTVQIITAVAGAGVCAFGRPLPEAAVWVTAAITVVSGLHYTLRAAALARADSIRIDRRSP